MKVDLAKSVSPQLTSSNWLDVLGQVSSAIETGADSLIHVDLTDVTWIGHLPLMALCLTVQSAAKAQFSERRVVMPESAPVRAFLQRWHFDEFVRQYGFAVSSAAFDFVYSEAPLASRVLPIHSFSGIAHAKDLRQAFHRPDTDLRRLLETGAFLNERDIQGLADLVIYELCENAVQHSDTPQPAVIFGRISSRDDTVRPTYAKTAGEWERMFFNRIRTEGMTELVIGDAGRGIISSLRKAARGEGITEPKEVLRWAFEPLSTSKRDRSEHTRGLWAVKNKVRELRGILYVRTGASRDTPGGGWSAAWDFFNEPARDAPRLTPDSAPFAGTQVQILLPHRTEASPYTFIEYHRPILARQKQELVVEEISIPAEPGPFQLTSRIETLDPETSVLFVDMSQMNEVKWTRGHVDHIGKQISDGLRRRNGRIWLLNPPATVVMELGVSSWIAALWREAILIPYVTISDSSRPPRISYVTADAHVRSNEPGDTEHARRTLLQLIGAVAGAGEVITNELVPGLQSDELQWVRSALSKNRSIVEPAGDGSVAAALDVEKLGRRAVISLLRHSIQAQIEQKIADQRSRPPLLYRLPSQMYCREYIDPRVLSELSPAARSALETWVEERVLASRASYAISYTNFAIELLTRAERTGAVHALEPLRHYSSGDVQRTLSTIPSGSRVVLLAAISGSGQTIVNTVHMLRERGITTDVVCIVDTTTDRERSDMVRALGSRDRLISRASWPIEKWRESEVPPEYSQLPIAIIDPETLLPVLQVADQPTRLRDGEFWHYAAEASAVTVGDIRYKGIDYTTHFWMQHLLERQEVVRHIIEDFRTCFERSAGVVRSPDIICYTEDTAQVMSKELENAVAEHFPGARIVQERTINSAGKLEGAYVVIFSAASNSGAGLARLQRYFQTAKRIHLSIFLNRVPNGLMLALTGSGTRVSLTSFQRLMSASPGLRLGSARSIAIPALLDYRASALSNRLLLFIEEERRKRVADVIVAQSADELEQVAKPDPKPGTTFDITASYTFSTAAGQQALQRLVRSCREPDEKWLYGILDEVASRAEADPQVGSPSWRNAYIEQVRRLYTVAPTDDTTARRKILEGLLLDRWRRQARRDLAGDVANAPGVVIQDDISFAFARELLEDLKGANEALCEVIIRSISKIAPSLLIQWLETIIEVARGHRNTELSLALEFTKILDDDKTAGLLLEELSRVAQARTQGRPVGRDEPFDIALEDLLADVGLFIAPTGQRTVRFLPWPSVRAILENEPPDHDRTIRSLIRCMRGEFGPAARFLYYREVHPGRYAYGDAWPRRVVANTEPIPLHSRLAIDLLGGNDSFISQRLGTDPRPVARQYLQSLGSEAETFSSWGIALFRLRGESEMGLLRVWQDVDAYGRLSSAAIQNMNSAMRDAVALIERRQSVVPVIGEWQYEQLIGKLHERHEDGASLDALEQFAERVRLLLGGDVASLLIREGTEWNRHALVGRARFVPLRFADREPGRLTVWVASHKEGRVFRDRKEAADEGFVQRPAVDWAESWFAIPLIDADGDCKAVVHVWHHVPAWFETARPLMKPLTALGSTVLELSATYQRAQEARQILSYDAAAIERVCERLLNATFAAEALAANLEKRFPERDTELLAAIIRQAQEFLAELVTQLPLRSIPAVPASLEEIVTRVVNTANEKHGEIFSLHIHGRVPAIPLRIDMMQRAIEELLRNARAHLPPDEKAEVELVRKKGTVVLEVRNPGFGVPHDRKNLIFEKGSGLLLARTAAERHGGQLEEVGEPGVSAIFRMVLPTTEP